MARRSKVQDEIGQKTPFRSPAHEAFIALLRTADVMKQRVARVVEPFGVTLQQYNVLRILRGAGEDGLHTLALADRMIERAPGITRMIDRLERKGLVSRTRRTEDRRCVVCRITARGLDLLSRMDEPTDRAGGQAVGGLSPSAQAKLIVLLNAVRAEPEQEPERG